MNQPLHDGRAIQSVFRPPHLYSGMRFALADVKPCVSHDISHQDWGSLSIDIPITIVHNPREIPVAQILFPDEKA
jgi:hypothetical protein